MSGEGPLGAFLKRLGPGDRGYWLVRIMGRVFWAG